jgi:hypothetical protein
MEHFILWAAASLLSTYLLFIFYLAVMNLKRVRDMGQLTTFAKVLGYPVLFVGLLMDFISNVLLFSVLFIEPPREFTVTSRLSRHYDPLDNDWRSRLAGWFKHHLDPFDPVGWHIK